MLAGQDPRVDAIVPMITWNDLARAFLPESTGQGPRRGGLQEAVGRPVLRAGGRRRSRGATLGGLGDGGETIDPAAPAGPERRCSIGDPACGRFAQDVCDAYLDVATTGRRQPGDVALLRRSSPAAVLDKIKAPTLLIQGQADSLFPISEAEANYRGIAANGTPVRVDWFTGGHDGGEGPRSDRDRLRFLTIRWLDYYLLGQGEDPGTGFTYSRVTGFDAETRRITTSGFSTDAYPGLGGVGRRCASRWPARRSASPTRPTATRPRSRRCPARVGELLQLPDRRGARGARPARQLLSPSRCRPTWTRRMRRRCRSGRRRRPARPCSSSSSTTPTPQAGSSLPFGLAAPVRLTGLPPTIEQAQPVTVTLPAIVHRFEAGHRLRLTIADLGPGLRQPGRRRRSTPSACPRRVHRHPAAGHRLAHHEPGGDLAVRARRARRRRRGRDRRVAFVVARLRRRRNAVSVVEEHADTPLVVRGLRKEYADGFVAVAVPSTSRSSAARSSGCSARTAPARRPRCGCCSA